MSKKEKSKIEEEFGEHYVPKVVKRRRKNERYESLDDLDEEEEQARWWETPDF